LRLLGRDLEALAEFDRALVIDPSNTNARLGLGEVLCQLDYVEEVLELLEPLEQDKRTKRDQRAIALARGGEALCAMARFDEADSLLRQAIALDDRIGWFHYLRGRALENLDRAGQALSAYQLAMERLPSDENFWERKGVANALYLDGQLEKAKQEYQQVIDTVTSRIPSLDVDTLSLLGWCHYRLGKFDQALRLLMQAQNLNPADIPNQFDVSLVLLGLKRNELAVREYERAVEATHGHEISRRRGIYQIAINDLEVARREGKELADSTGAAMAHVLLEKAQNQTLELLREMEKFTLRVRRSIEICASPGTVYRFLNQFEKYPEFCGDVRAVASKGDRRLSWKTVDGGGQEVEWEAEILQSFPNSRLSWRSTTPTGWCCSMTIAPIPNATWLIVHRSYVPEMIGPDRAAASKLVAQRLVSDLEKLKWLIETRSRIGSPSLAGSTAG